MTERDKFEDSEGTGTEAESATKLQVVMSLPDTYDRIVHGNAGTNINTSWLRIGTRAGSATKLQVVMSLPDTHVRICHGNTGTNTSWLTVDENRCQVLERGPCMLK